MRVFVIAILIGCSGPKSSPPPIASATAECPAAAPADRSSCGRLLTKCRYPNEPRCPFAHCADVASQLVWVTSYDHCPIACPTTKPAAGAACSPVTTQTCEYKGGEKCGFRMRCTASGWAEEEITLCGGM